MMESLRHIPERFQQDAPGYEMARIHGLDNLAGVNDDKARTNAPQITHAMLSFGPFRQVVPGANRPRLTGQTADAVQAQMRRKRGPLIEL